MDNKKFTLKNLYTNSVNNYPNNRAYSIINGESLTYKELGIRAQALISILNSNGVEKGEKVAILSGSMPNWPLSYLAITTSARVAVPLLPDFTAFEITNIIKHSGAKSIILSKKLLYKLSDATKEELQLIIDIESLEVIKSSKNESVAENTLTPEEEDTAAIIYTSGTSGTSKGVILTHKNIVSNIEMTSTLFAITTEDVFLSFLPLSHAYECTLGMLYPFSRGASVTYLNGAPTATILMPALKKVKPTCICSVPLIVEKIFKNSVRPKFTSNLFMRMLYSFRPVRRVLHGIAGKKIIEMFGGRLRFFGIGGSKLDASVEQFLRDAKFPYAIGYGLTECSPLIAGQVENVVYQSTGPKLKGVEMKIHNPNKDGIGEIIVRGANIMKGYYKDPIKTESAFIDGEWFRTKDLGIFDSKGNLYIKGRVDNMLIGANGENIYPEEIEAIINDNSLVMESLVTKVGDRLVAKVHFNQESVEAIKEIKDIGKELTYAQKQERLVKELLIYVNERVNKNSKISEIIVQPIQFEKTATQKVKRYLYN